MKLIIALLLTITSWYLGFFIITGCSSIVTRDDLYDHFLQKRIDEDLGEKFINKLSREIVTVVRIKIDNVIIGDMLSDIIYVVQYPDGWYENWTLRRFYIVFKPANASRNYEKGVYRLRIWGIYSKLYKKHYKGE